MAHDVELLTTGSTDASILLHEEQYKHGGARIEELYTFVYAQVLSSHALTYHVLVQTWANKCLVYLYLHNYLNLFLTKNLQC